MSNDFVLLSQDQVDLLSKKTNRVRRHRFPDLVLGLREVLFVRLLVSSGVCLTSFRGGAHDVHAMARRNAPKSGSSQGGREWEAGGASGVGGRGEALTLLRGQACFGCFGGRMAVFFPCP